MTREHTTRQPLLGYQRDKDSSPGVPVDLITFPTTNKAEIPFSGARFVVEPGSASVPEAHEVRECWMVAAGQGEVCYDEEIFPLQTGDVFLFEPFKTHQARNTSSEPLVIFTIWW